MIDALERRSHLVVPTLLALVVVPLALTLMIIGARSPYTHANLAAGYDPSYSRTDQALVGTPVPFEGMMSAGPLATDPVERGRQLFVVKDCASCHGLDGRGGIVGPPIAGTSAHDLRVKTRVGPGGMPAFAANALSDDDLKAIAAYLQAMSQ
jgi:mono/diheme cytochrome c family protein